MCLVGLGNPSNPRRPPQQDKIEYIAQEIKQLCTEVKPGSDRVPATNPIDDPAEPPPILRRPPTSEAVGRVVTEQNGAAPIAQDHGLKPRPPPPPPVDQPVDISPLRELNQDPPSGNESSSKEVDESSSKEVESSSKVDESSSKVDESSSKEVDESSSKEVESSSKVDESSSKVDESSSKVDELTSKVDESSSKVDESSSKVDESSSKVDESSSKVDESSSKDSESSSKNDESSHDEYQHIDKDDPYRRERLLLQKGYYLYV